MRILRVAILLVAIYTLGACGQQEACLKVQKKLQALSEAVQVLCGSSTPPPTTVQPTTAQPPVVQPCDCSTAVNWTSVPMTRIAYSQLRHTGILAYDIPSVIPSSAKEVLMLASVTVGGTGPAEREHFVKIYTKQDLKQYEKYILLRTTPHTAYNTNSDNLWFPMTSGRQMFVELTYAHTGQLFFYLHVIGYR